MWSVCLDFGSGTFVPHTSHAPLLYQLTDKPSGEQLLCQAARSSVADVKKLLNSPSWRTVSGDGAAPKPMRLFNDDGTVPAVPSKPMTGSNADGTPGQQIEAASTTAAAASTTAASAATASTTTASSAAASTTAASTTTDGTPVQQVAPASTTATADGTLVQPVPLTASASQAVDASSSAALATESAGAADATVPPSAAALPPAPPVPAVATSLTATALPSAISRSDVPVPPLQSDAAPPGPSNVAHGPSTDARGATAAGINSAAPHPLTTLGGSTDLGVLCCALIHAAAVNATDTACVLLDAISAALARLQSTTVDHAVLLAKARAVYQAVCCDDDNTALLNAISAQDVALEKASGAWVGVRVCVGVSETS